MGFGVLNAVVMKSSAFWDITPCNPLGNEKRRLFLDLVGKCEEMRTLGWDKSRCDNIKMILNHCELDSSDQRFGPMAGSFNMAMKSSFARLNTSWLTVRLQACYVGDCWSKCSDATPSLCVVSIFTSGIKHPPDFRGWKHVRRLQG
jgi:hypothetical protein